MNLGPGRYKSFNEFGSDTRCFSISPPRTQKPVLIDSRDYETQISDRATRVKSPSHAFCEYPYEKQPDPKPKTIKAKKKSNFPQKVNYSKPVVRKPLFSPKNRPSLDQPILGRTGYLSVIYETKHASAKNPWKQVPQKYFNQN